ncbi:hypothetical protein ATN88_16015 [Enterovibrio coralii]|uniref:EAL domain-containing protein n=2 Tax=Enterovibrio coralii TaxID=294935 RepID=A0A135I5Q8_9GAMM|nr:hypothetical protein ATN88_16015 [Enterovibrio coralii]
MHYQAIYTDKNISYAEALFRNDEVSDMESFIKSQADALAFDKKVIEKVISEIEIHRPSFPISVNVSAASICNENFVDFCCSTLLQHNLYLELIEDGYPLDYLSAKENISKLEVAGVKVIMDDFGVKDANFINLIRLGIKNIKIDKSLVLNVDSDTEKQRILKSIVGILDFMKIEQITYEGVETNAQYDAVRNISKHCAIQGFLLSQPTSMANLTI